MKGSLRLGHIAGIEIGIHYTWLLAFILITWSLAQHVFPQAYLGTPASYWITGVLAALLLFVSVLLHELAHSLVAQARGLHVGSITLFIFGGVSNIEEEPEKPAVEFTMAIVGPLTSLVLAGIFFGVFKVVESTNGPLAAMLLYLAMINALLAAFNLLPGFPLDGGRMLRSILWGTTGDLRKATNIAALAGRFFGWALIAFGVFRLLVGGDLLGGLWIAFIGWFLSSAADASRREVTLRENLSGVSVKEIMDPNPETISPQTSVAEVVREIFFQRRRRAAPVCQDDQIVGIVTLTDIKGSAQQKWTQTPVAEIMTRQPLHSVVPEDDLTAAMKIMAQHDINQVLVLHQGRLVGLLSRADIIRHLQLSQELGLISRLRRS